MIRNIVFDMGGVLFAYDTEEPKFVRRYCRSEEDAVLVDRELFHAPEWIETDRGTLSDDEYLALVLGRVPERLYPVTRYLFEHWHEMPRPFPEVEEVVRSLKENGYKIYLLSNMSTRFYRLYKHVPAMKYFDGMIVSSDLHVLKPEPEIYFALFDRFGLLPEECFFIDDRAENVEGGEKLGMKGFCYRWDVEELKAALRAANIKV